MEQAHELQPHSLTWGGWLCIGLQNVASVQSHLAMPHEALHSYERLVAVQRRRVFQNPAVISLRGDLSKAYFDLGRHQQRIGRDATLTFRRAREVLENIPRDTPDELYELAAVYAILARPVESAAAPNNEIAEPGAEDLAEQAENARLAIEILQKACDAGFVNAQALRTNKDFDALRNREDFQELLALVGAAAAEAVSAAGGSAEDQLASKLQAAERLRGEADVRHRETLAATLHAIGLIQTGLKQFEEAEASLNESLQIRAALRQEGLEAGQHRVDLAATHVALGQLAWESEQCPLAVQRWQTGLELLAGLDSSESNDAALRRQVADLERAVFERYGEIGLWERAIEFSVRNVAQKRVFNPVSDSRFAILLLATGDVDGHRQYGRLLADTVAQSEPAHTLWVAAMNPNPALSRDELIKLAEKVAGAGDSSFDKAVAAGACYRAGEYQRALDVLQPVSRYGRDDQYAAFLLAMIHHEMGKSDEARRLFDNAERDYQKDVRACHFDPRGLGYFANPAGWWELAHGQVLRQQAWREIKGQDAPDDPWQHLIQARGYRLIGEIEKSDGELAAAAAAAAKSFALVPHDPHWNSARMRLCREIASDAELFVAVQKLRPEDADLSIARGQILAEAEKWDEAAECFGRVIDRRGLSLDAFQSACLHLLTNRPDAYRQFCTKLIGQAGEVTDPHVAFVLARTCILVPQMAASPEQVVSWAEQAVSGERVPWHLHVLGAASFRAGQYGRAIELLEESSAGNWSAGGEAQNALVLAIAHKRQGNSLAATECLQRARALMAEVHRPPPPDWLEYHVLVREAEAVIEAAVTPH